jgi:hypothetical protein
VDRLMGGFTTVASALNANDQCLARIAAVHLQIPDLPSPAARDAERPDRETPHLCQFHRHPCTPNTTSLSPR